MSLNKELIESTALRLTEPGVFTKSKIEHKIKQNDVVVEPYLGSICHADLRYYSGDRRQDALNAKLPMALFHEALAVVHISRHPGFKSGDRVVIVPSIPGYILDNKSKSECCANCRNGGDDNYCLNGIFLGSGFDGAGQSKLVIGGENLVHVPEELDDQIAILAELCSVSLFAINLIDRGVTTAASKKVAVFGDGPLGYLTAATLRFIYNIPKENLHVFGVVPEKLAQFEDFATTVSVNKIDFEKQKGFRTAFECTGGNFSSDAVNQAINLLDVQGNIVLMGVSEELVPINTRDILEKGIRLYGSSRSTIKEFQQLMKAFVNVEYQNVLKKLVPDENFDINSLSDLREAMDAEVKNKGWKKTYLAFNWNNMNE